MQEKVTICAVDCLYPKLAARAIELSSSRYPAARCILFSDQEFAGDFEFIEIENIGSINEYSRFLLRELDKYVETDFVLIVQWDGYVINDNAFWPEFFDYDYIGAVWPQFSDGMNVGNGGFSFRSKKLLTATATDPSFINSEEVEDITICRTGRLLLEEKYNIRFAPGVVARKFSYEQEIPTNKTFGFHGLGNIWRHESPSEILEIVKQIRPSYYENYQMHSLLMHCFLNRKYRLFAYLYRQAVERIGPDLLSAILIIALTFDERDVKKMVLLGNIICKCQKALRYLRYQEKT